MTNRLAGQTSPYLLQHAENPVDWYPWGDAAFGKARQEDKPIFLSIGYAACHWCHVMAHESFENPAIAATLNQGFVSIKVDREERPDIDSIYMNFVVSTTGSGGWPLSVFLTPQGKPFYGGTYFPPFRSHNLPAFREVLDTVARFWRTDQSALLESADNLAKSLQSTLAVPRGEVSINLTSLEDVIDTVAHSYDPQNGGWGGAVKFPQPMLIEFLLRQALRGNQQSLAMALHTLRAMAQGGMFDVLGGGFSRYSVEPTWLVPHFEKMLYDNAQLARVYLHAYQITGDTFFRDVCTATLDFVLRELTHPSGGFFSSLDADSEGEEGKYYLWTPQQLRAALGSPADAELFLAAYGVTDGGNFAGCNILRRALSAEQLAQQCHLDAEEIPSHLQNLCQYLLEVRNRRNHPAVDDKVLVAWNALMLASLAEAGSVLNRPDYLEAAIRNAGFILDNLWLKDRLLRSWRDGKANQPAYLEDYAALGLSLLTLYQSDPNPRWYQAALQLLEQVLRHFPDPAGGFFDTADDHEALLYRPKDIQDNATPSGNALTLNLLLQLSAYEGRSDWRQLAEKMLISNLGLVLHYPSAFAQWLCAVDYYLGPAYEVAIVGDWSDPATRSLLQSLQQRYQPRVVLAASSYPPPPGSPALLRDRPLLNGRPTAYVCQGFICRLPVNDPQAMLAQL